jgi:hypothetical protein
MQSLDPGRGNRFDHMVRRFSNERDLISRLRGLGVDRVGADQVLRLLASGAGIDAPDASFHRGRGPHTGFCMPPREVVVATAGEAWLSTWEGAKRRRWPEPGLIRLGEPTALGTIAHEFAHHMVHVFDPVSTPAHGKRWVERFDGAAVSIATVMDTTPAGP